MNTSSTQVTNNGNDLELIEEATPLATLESDIGNLQNCLSDYQQRLSAALQLANAPRPWAGLQLSLTTMCLFGTVALFALVVNTLLALMHADSAQLMQANCGMGVLYALVCMSALYDMSSAKNAVRSEAEALRMRIVDVTEQFRELLRTRQSWVEESTRTQWASETDKLKLQLVKQELQATQAVHEQCRETEQVLKSSIATLEAEAAKLAKDCARQTDELKSLNSNCTQASNELERLSGQQAAVLEQIEQSRAQQILEQEKAILIQSEIEAANLELERLSGQQAAVLEQIEQSRAQQALEQEKATLIQSEIEASTLELDQVQSKLASLRDEVSICDAIQLEQSDKLEDMNQQLAAASEKIANLSSTLDAKQQEFDVVEARIHTQTQDKVAIDEQIVLASQELVALRNQKEEFAESVNELSTQRDQLLAAVANLQEEANACEAQTERITAQLQASGQQLTEAIAERLSAESELEKVSCELQALKNQEAALQAKVDWMLGQLGELERLSSAQLANGQVIDQLESIKAERTTAIAALKLEEEQLNATVSKLQAEIELLDSDLQMRTEQLHDLTKQHTELTDAVAQMQSLTDECRQEYAAFTLSTREQMAQRQIDLQAYDDKLAMQAQELDALNSACIGVQEELRDAQELLQSHRSELRNAQELLEAVQESCTDAQSKERQAEQRAAALLEKAESIAEQVRVRSDDLDEAAYQLAAIQEEICRLEAMKESYERIASDSDRLDARMADQRTEALELAALIDERRGQEEALQSEAVRITEHLLALRGELDTTEIEVARRQSVAEELELECTRKASQRGQIEQDISQLTDMFEHKYRQVQSLETQIVSQTEELETLKASQAALTSEVAELQSQVSELQSAIEPAELRWNKVTRQYKIALEQLAETETRLAEQRNQESVGEERLAKLNAEQANLGMRIEQLTSEVNESQSIAGQWQEYLAKLKSEIQRLEADKVLEQRMIDESQRRQQQLQASLDETLNRQRVLDDRLVNAQQDLRQIETRSQNAREEADSAEIAHMRLMQQVAQAESQLERLLSAQMDAQRELDTVRSQAQSEQAELEQVTNAHEKMSTDLFAAEQRAIELAATISDHESAKQELMTQLKQLEADKQKLVQDLDALRDQQQATTDRLEQQRIEAQRFVQDIERYRNEISECELQLETLTADHDTQSRLLLETNHQLALTQEQLGKTSDELQTKVRELTDCSAELAEREEQAAAIQQQREEQLEQMRAEIAQLRLEEETVKARQMEFARELLEQHESADKLLTMVKHARQGLEALRENVQIEESRLTQTRAAIELGDDELQRNLVRLDDLRAESADMDALLTTQTLQHQKTEQELEEKMAALSSLQQRIATCQAAKSSLERNLAQLTAENERLSQELKRNEELLANLQELQQAATSIEQAVEVQEAIHVDEAVKVDEAIHVEEAVTIEEVVNVEEVATVEKVAPAQETATMDAAVAVEEIEKPSAADSAVATSELDVWKSVEELSQLVNAARASGGAQPSTGSAYADPWATVLADRV